MLLSLEISRIKMSKAVVIVTGGPGFGKTSVIERLSNLGFRVGSEIARELIEEQVKTGGVKLPWKDIQAFREEVFVRRLSFLNSVTDDELAFSDRGIPDQLAFARYQGAADPHVLVKNAEKYRYFPVVFLTSPWKEIYHQDSIRTETFEEASRLHEFICQTYHDLGYQLIDLPKTAPSDRAEFIKNYITKLNYETIKKTIF